MFPRSKKRHTVINGTTNKPKNKFQLTYSVILAVHWIKIWINGWILEIKTFPQTRR
jgi:hypothetical protein